nr:unnamed protein product [Callosobruchus chinensis]
MYTFRLYLKRKGVLVIFAVQLCIILSYIFVQFQWGDPEDGKITFVRNNDSTERVTQTYHTSNFVLKLVNTRENYVNFNSSLCFKYGTDLVSMTMSKGNNWSCKCLQGWHGNDCGQPEVLWRALLAHHKPTKIKGPRTFERRLIYLFKVNEFTEHLADIRINELGNVVDLFILYEDENTNYLLHKLNNNFCKEQHDKILYVQETKDNLWERLIPLLKNLRDDDIILSNDNNEIPNKDALIFLKYYDHWPEPIKFRMRWSVFGFFWLHPSKTITSGGACTVSFLKESFDNQFKLLSDNKTLSSPLYKGLTLGDLNHYGGWFCEYCTDAAHVVNFLANKPKNVINWNKINYKKIDQNYIEELIENGVYIDGVQQLEKAHKYRDKYFAPPFVRDHDWKYDFLLINFYSKMDYYEG